MSKPWPDLTKVEEEMARFDAMDWQKRWEATETNEQVMAVVRDEREALARVQLAFYEATSDRNGLRTCMQVPVWDLRHFLKLWKEAKRVRDQEPAPGGG